MDSLDHQNTGHEIHLCHRCGWPFPNPHPSAKHRRAHKKVCGTIEGYKLSAVSDDDHASDDDRKTPSPKAEKKSIKEFDSSGAAGSKSNKSEDELFSDAVTEFSVSPDFVGNSVKGNQTASETAEQLMDPTRSGQRCNFKAVEHAMSQLESIVPPSDTSAEAVSVSNNGLQSGSTEAKSQNDVISGNINEFGDGGMQQEPVCDGQYAIAKGEEDKAYPKSSGSMALDSDEGKTSDFDGIIDSKVVKQDLSPQFGTPEHTDAFAEVKKDADLAADVNAESDHDLLSANVPGTDNPVIMIEDFKDYKSIESKPPMDPSSAEITSSVETVDKVTVAEEGYSRVHSVTPAGSMNVSSTGSSDFSAVEDTLKVEAAKVPLEEAVTSTLRETHTNVESFGLHGHQVTSGTENYDIQTNYNIEGWQSNSINSLQNDVSEYSSMNPPDIGSFNSSTDKEVDQETKLNVGVSTGNCDASKSEKDVTGGRDSEDLFSVKSKATFDGAENSFVPKDDQTTMAFVEDGNHHDEKASSKLLDAENGCGEAVAMCNLINNAEAVNDDSMQSLNSTNFSSSVEVDCVARDPESPGKINSTSLDCGDDGSEGALQGLETGNDAEVLECVTYAGIGDKLTHDGSDASKINSATPTSKEPVSLLAISELPNNNASGGIQALESIASDLGPEHPISSEILEQNNTNENSCAGGGDIASESVDADGVGGELDRYGNAKVLSENSEKLTSEEQETLPVGRDCSNETCAAVEKRRASENVSTLKSNRSVLGAEHIHDGDVASDKSPPISISNEAGDGDDAKLTRQKDCVSSVFISGASSSQTESLEGNWGSVLSSPSDVTAVAKIKSQPPEDSEDAFQKHKTIAAEEHPDKSDNFEPPSFATLVQSAVEIDQKGAASEIKMAQNAQQPKSEAVQDGWFPSITNVVNESQGRKKNEEIIAKVTNWSSGKQHSPLKNLLSEAKSPNPKQVPAANQKDENATKDNGPAVTSVNTISGSDQAPNKEMEEWNSPARYPTEIKKEKRKGKAYWVPFVCCSSVHRDL